MTTVFEVIYTFENREQQFGNSTFPGLPSEATVIKEILNKLSVDETNELRKLSLCQINCNGEGPLQWVREHTDNLKYYFGVN